MKLLSLFFLILLSACARPDYLDETPLTPPTSQNDTQDHCPIPFNQTDLCAKIIWKQNPNSTDFSEFELHFNQEVALENLSVILWMPSMGHGSSPVKIEALSSMVFRIYKVFFIMPGDWEIRISINQNPASPAQASLPLVVP